MAVLDTTFLIDLQRGLDAAHAALHVLAEGPERLLVPAQAAVEYLAGMEDPIAGLNDLQTSFEIVPFGRDHVLEAARVGRAALTKGEFPGWADTQIGATAVLTGSELVTADPENFRSLDCEVWDYRNEVREPQSG